MQEHATEKATETKAPECVSDVVLGIEKNLSAALDRVNLINMRLFGVGTDEGTEQPYIDTVEVMLRRSRSASEVLLDLVASIEHRL